MRFGFPLMLVVSAALHLSLAAGFFVAHFHGLAMPATAPSDQAMPRLVLLHTENAPETKKSLPQQHVTNSVVAKDSAHPIPTPLSAKKVTSLSAPDSLALQALPKSHLPSLAPENILSPKLAPSLNSESGVVFLLDVSGSMYEPYEGSTRLNLARQMLSQSIRALPNGTPFAITIYGETALASGPLVAASDATREAAVHWIMGDINCGGGTNLPAAFVLARDLRPGQLVLFTDGDLNISARDLSFSARCDLGRKGYGPALSIFGICPRTDTDAAQLLQGLADEQGGTYRETSLADTPELVTTTKAVGALP